jgi:hypothetical protein
VARFFIALAFLGKPWYCTGSHYLLRMLYRYKPTGALLEVVTMHGDGILMCVDAQDEVLYVEEDDLVPQLEATTQKMQTEERLADQLEQEGVKPAKPTNKETFPLDNRLNINTASARQIADTLPGVGLKTARDIKDLQTSMTGEKFMRLDQLKTIKRVDWDEIITENLIRVE